MKTIGIYEIGEVIGQGGMGTVYRGRDPRFDRTVAIKVLHAQFCSDPSVAERFTGEAVIQAKLNHPHIVTVFDFIAENGTLAFVMELVDGKPLDELIVQNRGPLPTEFVVEVGKQVCWALDHAHRVGLVHRDIKPSNILIAQYGKRVHAKVMDFGVAKILGSEKMRTATTAKMGTLAYMSPEHLKSPKHVDHRTDIYSLGATLHEMATGSVPFDGDSEYELMSKIIETSPPRIALPGPAGDVLAQVIQKAMARTPEQRFQSAADLGNALEKAGATRATPVDNAPPRTEQSSPNSIRRPMNTTVILVGLVLVFAIVIMLFQYRTGEDHNSSSALPAQANQEYTSRSVPQPVPSALPRQMDQVPPPFATPPQSSLPSSNIQPNTDIPTSSGSTTEQTPSQDGSLSSIQASTSIRSDPSERLLRKEELEGLTKWELLVLRNIPYARHGYAFRIKEMKDYFGKQPWYRPTIPAQQFQPTMLTPIEQRNIDLIIHFQKERGLE